MAGVAVTRTILALALLLSCAIHDAAAKRPCKPKAKKLSKMAMAQKSLSARAGSAAGRPDPECKTGVVSLAGTPQADGPQVCCPAYCGECSDYPTCASVKGQASENACCASKVLELDCEGDADVDVCLKKCAQAMPPCIMAEGEEFEMPEASAAADDCNEAVPEWMANAESAVTGVDGGSDQWADLEKKGEILDAAEAAVSLRAAC